MGTVSFSASALILIVAVVALIAIFPVNLCLPFTTTCIYLEPLHQLKNTMVYSGAVFLALAIIVSFIIGLGKGIQFLRRNKSIKHATLFILTFDEKHWNRLRKSLA